MILIFFIVYFLTNILSSLIFLLHISQGSSRWCQTVCVLCTKGVCFLCVFVGEKPTVTHLPIRYHNNQQTKGFEIKDYIVIQGFSRCIIITSAALICAD